MSDFPSQTLASLSTRLETVFENHRQELTRYASRRLGVPDHAADLVQEAFLKASTFHNLGQVENLRAFLFRVVTNLATDHHRKTKRNRRIFTEAPDDRVVSVASSETPDQQLINEEQVKLLTRAIQSLPPQTREMFILFKLEEWKQKDIAAHFNVSLSTVEKKLKQAIMHCRNQLSE
ncbi:MULTISPECIES: RNA polymerase sigma factor [unclassified Nitrospina]|uniref:RNA polymerase sigma factor n=1 Tax=unclassified Nitrospina TaxID=2638683 RepID=UPI003F9D5184